MDFLSWFSQVVGSLNDQVQVPAAKVAGYGRFFHRHLLQETSILLLASHGPMPLGMDGMLHPWDHLQV